MKKIRLVISSIIASLALTSGLVLTSKSADKVDAAVGNYATDPNTYYNGITATSGKQLAAQLHDLTATQHRTYTSYDDVGKNLYQQNTDQYYDSNNQKVTGYIQEFYTGVQWPNAWTPTAGDTTGGYNREHVWCKSQSGGLWKETGAGSDMHQIRPTEVTLNSSRNNTIYGPVTNRDSHKKYARFGTNTTYALGGYNDGSAFEPLDNRKGDVARILLYIYIHYNSYTVSELFDNYGTTNGNGSPTYFTSTFLPLTYIVNKSTEEEAIQLLLDWNTSDPVDYSETKRNNQVAVYQGNRNPFIDNPSYADSIWGDATGITAISKTSANLVTGATTTINAISSNSGTISWSSSNTSVATISSATSASGSNITITAVGTGSATITASISIDGVSYSKTCSVTVTAPKVLSSIAISGQKTSFHAGESFSFNGTVTATYNDSSTSDVTTSCSFSGYDMDVEGSQTVTVSYTESGVTRSTTYSITVNPAVPTQSFTWNLTTACYSSQSAAEVDWTSTIATMVVTRASSSTTAANNYIPGTEQNYKSTRFYKTNPLVITPASGYTIVSIVCTATTDAFATAFSGGTWTNATASKSGTVVTLTPTDGTSAITGILAATAGLSSIVINYYSNSAPTLTSITLDTENVRTTFGVGDTFSYAGLIVTAHYSDSSTEDLDSYDISSPDMSTAGEKIITVTYKDKTATYTITVSSAVPTSISASVSKTYFVGETISSSDITVEDNLGNVISNFTFVNDGYQFKYSDAQSGGALTNKTFADCIDANNMSCSLTVQVQRKARVPTGSVSDTLDRAATGVTGTSYTNWSGVQGTSGAVYAGQSAGANSSIQLRATNPAGIITTTSGGTLVRVSLTWESHTAASRVVQVYGKNTAYDSSADLYNNSASVKGTLLGTITYGTSTYLDITTSYPYIGVRSASSALYLSDITFTYSTSDTAVNLSNYIMYEDTVDQCLSKLVTAQGYFEGLSTSERSTFMTSTDYVVSTARDRFNAWIIHQGKTIKLVDGDYVIQGLGLVSLIDNVNSNISTIIIVVISILSLSSLGGYFYLRKKKQY